mgnify:CR=1 FL=1
MEALRVALAGRSYPIHIGAGLLGDASLYAPHLGAGRVAIVTNAVVAPLYLERIARALAKAGAVTTQVIVKGGEQAKARYRAALERIQSILADALG